MVSRELNVTQGSPGTDWWRICCTVSVSLKICSPLVLRFESHRSSALGSSADTTAAPCLMTKSNCMSTGCPDLALHWFRLPLPHQQHYEMTRQRWTANSAGNGQMTTETLCWKRGNISVQCPCVIGFPHSPVRLEQLEPFKKLCAMWWD